MGVVGRYIAAYAKIDKMFWWDKDMACGPIVEQGTHFGIKSPLKVSSDKQLICVVISAERSITLLSEPMLSNTSKHLENSLH